MGGRNTLVFVGLGALVVVGIVVFALLPGGDPFELVATDGTYRVDGRLVGLSDCRSRALGPPGDIALGIDDGAHVGVLGVVSERDGQPGFYGDVIVVEGTYADIHALAGRETIDSIPGVN